MRKIAGLFMLLLGGLLMFKLPGLLKILGLLGAAGFIHFSLNGFDSARQKIPGKSFIEKIKNYFKS